jgi:hypothetical protein
VSNRDIANTENIAWLEHWYLGQCNGDWEHQNGIRVETLDNPGWKVNIDLHGTRYDELQNFVIEDNHEGGFEWIVCRIEDGVFKGRGGPQTLGKIIQAFRKWIENY